MSSTTTDYLIEASSFFLNTPFTEEDIKDWTENNFLDHCEFHCYPPYDGFSGAMLLEEIETLATFLKDRDA